MLQMISEQKSVETDSQTVKNLFSPFWRPTRQEPWAAAHPSLPQCSCDNYFTTKTDKN